MNNNKYQVEVIFTEHAKQRMFRCGNVTEKFIVKDLLTDIYNSAKLEGIDIYKVVGNNFKYYYSVNNHKIILVTITYRGKNKKSKRKYINLSKDEVKKLLNIK